MKTSCLPICFFDDIRGGRLSLDQWHQMAAGMGLDGVEVYEPLLDSRDKNSLLRLRKKLRKLRLDISMLTGYANIADTDPKGWQAAVDGLKGHIEIAAIIGATIVRSIAGKWRVGSTRDTQLNYVARALRELIPFAANYGVHIALENHPQIGTKVEDFLEIVRRVRVPELQINLDTSNAMLSGGNVVALAEEVKDRVIHVHASDRFPNMDHCAVGEGVVNFPAIFKILKGAGFDGWISMEVGGVRGEDGIRQSLEYVRQVWEAA